MVLAQSKRTQAIKADADTLRVGYHDYEPTNGIRWTDGNAEIPAKLFATMNGPAMLIVELGAQHSIS